MSDRTIVSMLNGLIEVSKDGEKGFARAGQDSNDPALIQVFSNGEQACRNAAAELQDEVRILGGTAEESGSMKGAAHRGWVGLKNVMSSRKNVAILEECEKGEDYAKARYVEAMKLDLPEALRTLLERQYKGVVANHNRVRDLRNQYRS